MQDSKNKLEKQFYQTFNISKTYMNCNGCPHFYNRDVTVNNSKSECNFIHSDEFDIDDNNCVKLDFPPITDSIYMEFMVIIQRNHLAIGYPEIQTKDELKEFILLALLQNVDIVREEIHELLKGKKGVVDNNV